ncbi:DUF6175 family protein [Anaerophaga thermohalophila]|uniref:DUF6175 family protein n=1 Tax=Anaerophaga thermohalophila TaxID=177400 RepID=UPI0004750243
MSIILFFIGICSNVAFGQAKKPTLMILPSDNWCNQRYFMTEFNNQGAKVKVPDYKLAFQEDTELGQVISKISSLMAEEGFPLKNAEQELKNIEARRAEDNMTMSRTSGASIAESPLDMLKKRAKADILIQIWWKVTKTDKGKAVSFTLEAFDSYTSKLIASSTGTGEPSDDIVPILLLEAVSQHINPFLNQLQNYFNDMFENGREIHLTVKRWNNWEYYLDDEIKNKEIIDYINEWMRENTVNGRYNLTDATENFIRFEQVRIPIYNKYDQPMDARDFTNDLRKYLRDEPFNFDIKLLTRGLGEAILILGEK